MTEVIMSKMGDGMEEGLLLRWLKAEGEAVSEGDPIAEVQTDKANVELVAPASGTLSGIRAKEGENVPVGQTIAFVLAAGETAPANGAAPAAAAAKATQQREKATGADAPKEGQTVAPAAATGQPEGGLATISHAVASAPAPGGRVKASPLAKRLAKENGIDLAQVRGTGPQGRIVQRDLEELLKGKPAPSPVGAPAVTGTPVELTRMRKAIAARTLQSKTTIPHFYVTSEVDMERLMALRAQFNEDGETKLSVNDFILKACAVAIEKHRYVNMIFQNEQLAPLPNVNIGVMVAIDEGLVVPVVRECENKSLRTIAAEVKALADRGRKNQLSPEEMSGSSFSVSNMGMFDVENFVAIINPPNSAILAVGTAKKQPVVLDDGSIVARTRMKMTLSADHRILDGATAAVFLREIKTLLENPIRLVG